MDYLSQQQVNIESVSFNSIVILPNKFAGDMFFDMLYENCVDVVVYTCDGYYPSIPEFRDKVNHALTSRLDLNIIVFGAKYIQNMKILSKNIFIMDDLIMEDSSVAHIYRKGRLDLDTFKISSIIRSFLGQSKKRLLGSNLDEIFLHRAFKPHNKNYMLVIGKEL